MTHKNSHFYKMENKFINKSLNDHLKLSESQVMNTSLDLKKSYFQPIQLNQHLVNRDSNSHMHNYLFRDTQQLKSDSLNTSITSFQQIDQFKQQVIKSEKAKK